MTGANVRPTRFFRNLKPFFNNKIDFSFQTMCFGTMPKAQSYVFLKLNNFKSPRFVKKKSTVTGIKTGGLKNKRHKARISVRVGALKILSGFESLTGLYNFVLQD
jgi:hypothetical protein